MIEGNMMPSMAEWEAWLKDTVTAWMKIHPLPVAPVIITSETEAYFVEMRERHRVLWSEYILEESTRWWKERGYLPIWPESPNEPLSFIKLPEKETKDEN